MLQKNSQVPFNPLQDDLDSDDVVLDLPPRAKISRIIRHSRDKPIKQILQEKTRTFHTLSLSWGYMVWNGESRKLVANLKHLKSLRCLNIDLDWFLSINKGLSELAESLKHLKNLSVIHF